MFVKLLQADALLNQEPSINIYQTSTVCPGFCQVPWEVAEGEDGEVTVDKKAVVREGTSHPPKHVPCGIHVAFLLLQPLPSSGPTHKGLSR